MDGETRDSGQSLKILSADFTARLEPQPNLRIRTGAKRPIDLANLGCNKFGKVNRSLRSRSDSAQVHLRTKQKSCSNNKKLMVCYTDQIFQSVSSRCVAIYFLRLLPGSRRWFSRQLFVAHRGVVNKRRHDCRSLLHVVALD